jgi:hypothetical protein
LRIAQREFSQQYRKIPARIFFFEVASNIEEEPRQNAPHQFEANNGKVSVASRFDCNDFNAKPSFL